MKNLTLLLATLLIGGMMLTGCEKQNTEPTPTPDPTPTPTSSYVVYMVNNKCGKYVLSDCFKLNVTYTDANGQSVTENGVSIPWTKTIEVTAPFNAKMQGEYVFNEAQLPDSVVFGTYYGIGTLVNGTVNIILTGKGYAAGSKESFLNILADRPNYLQFSDEKDF